MLRSPLCRQGKACLLSGGMWPRLTLGPKSSHCLMPLATLAPRALRPWVRRSAFCSLSRMGSLPLLDLRIMPPPTECLLN